jgi:hypothetical protein
MNKRRAEQNQLAVLSLVESRFGVTKLSWVAGRAGGDGIVCSEFGRSSWLHPPDSFRHLAMVNILHLIDELDADLRGLIR